MNQQALPTFEDVLAARRRIAGRVFETPVLRVPALDEIAGAELHLKAENLQRIGAFKARGAMNAVLQLSKDERRAGIVTYSSGNHGQAVALAAREVGSKATVVMPTDAPTVKVDAVRALGAEIVFAGRTSADRYAEATRIAERTGAYVLAPFDDASVIAGQGTATLELLERTPDLDAVLVPVGGGGLLAGACLAAAGKSPSTAIVSVEPEAASAFAESLRRGERTRVEPGPTIADGLRPVMVGDRNFAIARSRVAHALTVSEEAIGRAVVRLLLLGKVLAEPSGAAALAAALERLVPGSPKKVGVILSGGNVSPEVVIDLLGRHADPPFGARAPRPH
jgi:threonine dehydratase